MNWMKSVALAAALAFVLNPGATALSDESDGNVLVELNAVALPLRAALNVVPQLQRADVTEADFGILDRMLRDGKADLIDCSVLWAQTEPKEGRAFTVGGEELRYPIPDRDSRHDIDRNKFDPPFILRPASGLYIRSDFETRQLGTSFEVGTFGRTEDGRVSLGVVIKNTSFVEFRRFSLGTSADGTTGTCDEPTFDCQSITTSLLCTSGRTVLLGTILLEHPSPRLLLVTIRATVLPTIQ